MRAYLQAIWNRRHFWMSLVRKDLRIRYRRSMLGIGWSMLNPLLMMIVLCTVFQKLFDVETSEYGPFLLVGLAFWAFITGSIQQGCHAFVAAEGFIKQTSLPLAIYPLRVTIGAGIHALISLGVALTLTWCFQGFGNLTALPALVPALMVLFVLGWSLSTLAASANAHFPDTLHLTEVGLQILFYATPILYTPTMLRERGLDWLIAMNPLAPLLEIVRQPIVAGTVPGWTAFAPAIGWTALAFVAASAVLSRVQNRLVFHL